MDDLSGLDWSAKPSGSQAKPPPMNMNPSYPSLRPSPSPFNSGRNTPIQPQTSSSGAGLQKQVSSSSAASASTKPAGDSFSNLMKFGPAKSNTNMSLAERQAQLEAERRKKEEEKRKQTEAAFGNGAFWDNLGNRGPSTASPASAMSSIASPPANGGKTDDDDLFAAFNKDTQVNKASHYPPPESRKSTPANALDLSDPNAWGSAPPSKPSGGSMMAEDDDDPFGLNEMKPGGSARAAPKRAPQPADDDDFMGDLNRPVEEIRREQEQLRTKAQPGKPIEDDDSSSDDEPQPSRRPAPRREASSGGDDFDRAVAKLVDYGFSPDDARRGITESGAGTNVQAVANWLLDDAHRRAKEKAKGKNPDAAPSQPERRANRSPANGGDDLAKTAAAMGNSLFKTANSLWKTGSKKMQQAYADFQQEGDPNQPKWMREAQAEQTRKPSRQQDAQATDEALMLDSEGPSRSERSSSRQPQPPRTASQQSRGQPSSRQNSPAPRWQQQSAPPAMFDSKAKLNRLAADDDISSYSSPNRRRRQAPQTEPKKPEPEPDLLFGTGDTQKPTQTIPERPAQRVTPQQQAPQPARRPQPKPSSPAPARPARQIPPISPDALQTSTKHRHAGTAHFKRGDYASAHASYSSSLSAVPPKHPLLILLLTNRALTALKTGEPKQAVDDADHAIALIGPGNGQGETVAVRGENGQDENRDMKDLYGKALSRKAEALEQMEKWGEAGAVWQQCVEAGVGGANAIKGRQRCQTALAPKPKPKPAAAKPRPRPTATASLAPAKSSEAVTRLREANEAAAKEDDEKFALSESVDARVSAWRDGKRDNLRALLGSMDNVLWANSGWKKVGLHELVAPNKVKINYMKAIAKTHPDKVRHPTSYLGKSAIY